MRRMPAMCGVSIRDDRLAKTMDLCRIKNSHSTEDSSVGLIEGRPYRLRIAPWPGLQKWDKSNYCSWNRFNHFLHSFCAARGVLH